MTAASQLPLDFSLRTYWTVGDAVPFDGAQLVVKVISQSQNLRVLVDKERACA